MLTDTLLSSHYHDKLVLQGGNMFIKILSLPKILMDRPAMICVVDNNDRELYKDILNVRTPTILNMHPLRDGNYKLRFYHQSSFNTTVFIGLNASSGLPFCVHNQSIYFEVSNNFEHNKDFFLKLKNDYFQKLALKQPTSIYHSDRKEIIEYAQRITKHKSLTYQKILAVHDWVADNLYYDMDALNSGIFAYEKYEPLSLIANRKTVCRGYSKLAVTLLRAIGIPAFDVYCNADGEGDCDPSEANHVITFALDNSRWIIMDPTWDSVNIYKDRKFSKKTQSDVMHQYFDTTLAFISYTHRFIR